MGDYKSLPDHWPCPKPIRRFREAPIFAASSLTASKINAKSMQNAVCSMQNAKCKNLWEGGFGGALNPRETRLEPAAGAGCSL
jgi:hypothetical protein